MYLTLLSANLNNNNNNKTHSEKVNVKNIHWELSESINYTISRRRRG